MRSACAEQLELSAPDLRPASLTRSSRFVARVFAEIQRSRRPRFCAAQPKKTETKGMSVLVLFSARVSLSAAAAAACAELHG